MITLSPFHAAARLAKRRVSFVHQLLCDLRWHRRYRGEGFPALAKRIREQARLLETSGIDGEDYYNHGLFRESLSFVEKAAFLGHYGNRRYFDKINPPVYEILARDKALFHILCASLDIPVPTILATIGPKSAPSHGLQLTNVEDVRAYLSREDTENVFLKPAGGSLGEGALALGARIPGTRAWRKVPSSETIDVEHVIEHISQAGTLRRFLIQRRLEPHQVLASIVPNVLATVRVMTYTQDSPLILGAVLRLGNGRGPTDNLSGGGVVVPIDRATGVLGLAVSVDKGIPERSDSHPFTGARIEGTILPYWDDILRLAVDSAKKLAFIPCIGWDIGVTDQGPLVVEINNRPRCRPVQLALDKGLLSGPLGKALLPHEGILHSGLNFGRVLH